LQIGYLIFKEQSMPITPFFDFFPTFDYNVTGEKNGSTEKVTNIFHRLTYIKDVINNTSSYYLYEIQDGDTPDILAEKIYGDANAGWMIIFANNILDPQWDWPIEESAFRKYIENKYGSLTTATSTIHHYEKVVETTVDDETTTRIYKFDYEFLSNSFDAYNINNKTVTVKTYGRSVTNYDYENELNESRRTIKIIKAVYYPQIKSEFVSLTQSLPKYVRTFE